jgi:hypothetical protein
MKLFKPTTLFKPIKDISDFIQQGLDSTKEGIDNLLGKGFKGGIKDVFDFSAEGLTQKADFDLGIGILYLTMDGDRESVDTAIKFRNELAVRLIELDEMAVLVKGFKAEDLNEVKKAAKDMGAFLARGEGNAAKPAQADGTV